MSPRLALALPAALFLQCARHVVAFGDYVPDMPDVPDVPGIPDVPDLPGGAGDLLNGAGGAGDWVRGQTNGVQGLAGECGPDAIAQLVATCGETVDTVCRLACLSSFQSLALQCPVSFSSQLCVRSALSPALHATLRQCKVFP
eukprot:SAG11_NODE_4472_length_1883_cov_2.336323_1_plen_143_part_00